MRFYCRPPHPLFWWMGFLWSLPWTLVGWALALLGGAHFVRREGPFKAWFFVAPPGSICRWFLDRGGLFPGVTGVSSFSGYTLGAIVVAATMDYVDMLLFQVHESRHVQQGFWFGLFLPVVYVASSLWEWIRGRNPYYDNWCERDARRASGEGV